MANINGQAEVVSKNGKGVKINNVWYNSRLPVFEGINRGDTLEFDYDEGSNGGKFVKGNVNKTGSAPANYKPAKTYSKPAANNYEVGAAVGMAVNNAVQLCISENKCFDEEYIRQTAVKIYTLAEEFKAKAAAGEFKKETNTETKEKELQDDQEDASPF
jgi:hypothetical protein